MAHRLSSFAGFDHSFKWAKHASLRLKSSSLCHVSNHNNIWNETHAQVMTNNFMYFNTLAKHSLVSSKKKKNFFFDLWSDLKLKNLILSLCKAFISPVLPEKNVPRFTITSFHVITFWHYIYLWTSIFKDEIQEKWNFIKNMWQTPWELTKNCNHFHQTRLMH